MKKIFLLFAATTSLFLTSCNDDDSNPNAQYSYNVRMTDAPAPYDAVYIDVQGVEVIGANGSSAVLETNAQVYNLLELSNGLSIEIASDNIEIPNVHQVRLILGTNNSVVVEGQSYPLSTPSAQQSGLKINVDQNLTANVENTLLIDFDAHQSIVEEGNGTYTLKPVLREVESDVQGNIQGSLAVTGVRATVTAESSTGVEYTTIVNENGQFKLSGLQAGTYTVTVTPATPLLPEIITNVQVTIGANTQLGVITLN
ncbi:Carbohydrate-binding protein [Flavobacterium sp. 9AF]|uniref:DUF4382 domain-containing protein n=1 Tax=Flavobacterium sp. 9AF TaxID=2653142 RepID=UPI0012EF91ED|nr:DUF4382 domain-containing protein [Flavobacterium sp. 9AF]VXB72718.1 Carbohydrate-binding protein [Flavobacterium sp. 9AF]